MPRKEIKAKDVRETRGLLHELLGVIMLSFAVYSAVALAGFSVGAVGVLLAKLIRYGLGVGAYGAPLIVFVLGLAYIVRRRRLALSVRFWALLGTYLVILAFWHHLRIPEGAEILPDRLVEGGGLAGGVLLFGLRKIFGFHGTLIVLATLGVAGFLVMTTWSLYQGLSVAKERAEEGFAVARERMRAAGKFYDQGRERRKNTTAALAPVDRKATPPLLEVEEIPRFHAPGVYEKEEPSKPGKGRRTAEKAAEPEKEEVPLVPVRQPGGGYTLPPLTLLQKGGKDPDDRRGQEMMHNAKVLEDTLASFSVKARIVHVSQGPAVTRYELEPAPGTKVSKIVSLSDDLALSLAAPGIRMEAPIPGKAAIGIEVPNKAVLSVPLREVLELADLKGGSKMLVALGKDIAGQPVTADLSKMPHLLVAGSTGSGKSVCINTIIASILFRTKPDEVKLILIDPKFVELSNYNGLPHLLTPVVTEPKAAAAALRWAVQEMERRYTLFAAAGVRDIGRYNEQIPLFPVENGSSGEPMPYVLIIIDELADLMMVAPVDVEDAIIRLAQKARAAGLHMVLATQRPSVDVITGLIKANVPSRIAFAVSSQIDSRTILDMGGAEKLLGRGDMLFMPMGAGKPVRVQGAFISDSEVERLTTYIRGQVEQPEYLEGVTDVEVLEKRKEDTEFEDELLEEAVRMIYETGQASTSMLQRKFRVGYSRAARLIDTMEQMKIIGPNAGSKPRDILMTYDQVQVQYFARDNE